MNVKTIKNNKEENYIVKLPRDRNQDAAEVVWVNNKRYEIKRGVEVEVPKEVYEVLANREKIQDELFDMIDANAK